MTTPTPSLIAGCLACITVIAVFVWRAHQLGRERQGDRLPDEHACEIGIGAGDAFTHHRNGDR